MTADTIPTIRAARSGDVPAICQFGERVVAQHYAPLIGPEPAAAQVRDWWNETQISSAVDRNLVLVAETDGDIVGVGQRGQFGDDHVIYKLYLDPEHRGHGLGLRLLDALINELPDEATKVYIEHFVGNERAGAFYEREGFAVDRIEPSPTCDPGLGQVWRVRVLA